MKSEEHEGETVVLSGASFCGIYIFSSSCDNDTISLNFPKVSLK